MVLITYLYAALFGTFSIDQCAARINGMRALPLITMTQHQLLLRSPCSAVTWEAHLACVALSGSVVAVGLWIGLIASGNFRWSESGRSTIRLRDG
jgi:hypothetical protein